MDPAKTVLFIPSELKKFKLDLFNRIGRHIEKAGGRTIRDNAQALDELPDDIIPIVGAAPYLLPLVRGWRERKRTWIGWDRGYVRRVFATWLPRGENGGFYRWHINRYQMGAIRSVSDDSWKRLINGNFVDGRKVEVLPWRKKKKHVVIAQPSATYSVSHDGAKGWTEQTLDQLARVTDRPIVIRNKETRRPLQYDLDDAHCLVTHGSIAAVEAVILGCPVIVAPDSAAALVGLTDINAIETPIYPERQQWLNSLAYCQFSETELIDGTLWRLIE